MAEVFETQDDITTDVLEQEQEATEEVEAGQTTASQHRDVLDI